MEIHRFTTTFEQQRRRVRVAQIGVIEINTHRMRAFEMVSQATVLWSTQEGYLQTWEKQSRSYPSVLRLPVERTSGMPGRSIPREGILFPGKLVSRCQRISRIWLQCFQEPERESRQMCSVQPGIATFR